MFSALFRRGATERVTAIPATQSTNEPNKSADNTSKPNQKRLYGPDLQFEDPQSNAVGYIDNGLVRDWISNPNNVSDMYRMYIHLNDSPAITISYPEIRVQFEEEHFAYIDQ